MGNGLINCHYFDEVVVDVPLHRVWTYYMEPNAGIRKVIGHVDDQCLGVEGHEQFFRVLRCFTVNRYWPGELL